MNIFVIIVALVFNWANSMLSVFQKSKEDTDTLVVVSQTDGFPDVFFQEREKSSYSYKCYYTCPTPYISSNQQMGHEKCFFYTIFLYDEIKLYEFVLHTRMTEHNSDERQRSIYLSLGEYSEQKGTIILTDSRNKLELLIDVISSDTMQFHNLDSPFSKQTFYNGLDFQLKKHIDDIEQAYIDSLKLESIMHADTILNINVSYPASTFYVCENQELSLHLNSDATYRYYVCGLLLSEGTWEQKGQRLDLHDKHLNHTFYGKITNQGIWSGYWPGDMEGTLLKRIEE